MCVYFFSCLLCGTVIVFRIMSHTPEESADEIQPTDEDIDALWDRLKDMSTSDRRKTMHESMAGLSSGSTPGNASKPAPSRMQHASTSYGRGSFEGQGQVHYTVDTTPRKIKNFSGSDKIGGGEVDYKHWRRAAMRVLDDGEISENKQRLILLQSLVGTAEDSIDLHRQMSARGLVEMLDKLFGTLADGHDLLADFYQCLQQSNQTTGEYLNLLYVRLCEVVKQGGLSMNDMAETLLRQLIRGTSDEDMLVKLRLQEKVDDPPEFPDLIASVRSEEARRTERRLRLKRVVKVNASLVSSEGSCVSDSPNPSSPQISAKVLSTVESGSRDDVVVLRQRIAELEGAHSGVNLLSQRVNQLETQVRPGPSKVFCYRCGIDGHLAYDCSNAANKTLVDEKATARRNAARRGRGASSGNWSRLPQGTNAGNR